jgi:tripartite-type tricarboxylate transporter receptor subunit TctC
MGDNSRANGESSQIRQEGAMKTSRRKFLHFAAGALVLPAVSGVARAQTYPTRPITMIVPFAAGGATDVIARLVAKPMGEALGQSIIIENVGGADGSTGTGRAARAPADGYTIITGLKESQILNSAFYALPYDALKDFAPVSPLVSLPYMLFTRKTIPAADVNELITWLKANKGRTSAGIGNTGLRLWTAFFQREIGAQFSFVPYRGVGPAMQDLVAGQIDIVFGGTEQLPLMRAGSVKAYAVTSEKRLAAAPEIPTLREIGIPALSYTTWAGLFAPKGTPKDIVTKLNASTAKALADAELNSRLAEFGFEVFPREQQTPEALDAIQKADAEKWWPIISEFGIRAQ